jgi:tetratricopeptide (TPR) repeat protein
VGKVVRDRYLLEELVGQGGLGRVWRGRDQILGRPVAVKEVLLPEHLPEGDHVEAVAWAMREATSTARLSHPNVITIHDVVEQDGAPWIVMELVRGQSLAAEIEEHGRLPWQRVTEIGVSVAEALGHTHAKGVIHRDLKPANILVCGRRVLVIDFGIAHVFDATTRLTRTGMAPGTPHYMAPEQIEGETGVPADLWALGASLYEAVEGRPPFDGATLTAIFARILTCPPDEPQHAGPLHDLLLELLCKDPAERPDIWAVQRALAKAARQAVRIPELLGTGRDHCLYGRHAEGEAVFREALRLDPENAEAHSGLGFVLEALGRLEEAEREFREFVRLAPKNPFAYRRLGEFLRAAGRQDEAESVYREAIRFDPFFVASILQSDEAERVFREVIRLGQKNGSVHYGFFKVLRDQGKLDEAEAEIREVVRLNSGNAEAHNDLGTLLQTQGRLEEAERAFREVIRLDPEHCSAHRRLGEALWVAGRQDEAEAAFREAIRVDPEDTDAHYGLANLLLGTNRLDEAEAAFLEVIRLDPTPAGAHRDLAHLRREKHRMRHLL